MGLVIVGILCILAFIGLARPYIGLLAFLIVMELQPGELYPYLAPLHLERVIAAMLLIAFIAHGAKWRFPNPARWFLALYGAMVLSIPLAIWRGGAALFSIQFLEIVALFLFSTALLTTEARIRWFIVTEVLLVDWMGGTALWNYHHGIWQYTMDIDRAIGITSSAGDPNTLAATLLFTIPLAIALMVRGNPSWMRIIGLVSIALNVVTIVDTGSRGAAMGLVFLVLLLMLYRPKYLVCLPVLIALSPVVWSVIPQQYKARYETVDHLKTDESYQNRILSWKGGVAMFESNPVTGIGCGLYGLANGEKFWPGIGRKHYLNAHSLYFQTLGELGLLGIITFLGYLISVVRTNLRSRRKLAANESSPFLRALPGLFNVMFLQLLFAGYASHNLYRNTWYIVGAMAASVALLPAMRASEALAPASVAGFSSTVPEEDWSSALLPVLRKQVPFEASPTPKS